MWVMWCHEASSGPPRPPPTLHKHCNRKQSRRQRPQKPSVCVCPHWVTFYVWVFSALGHCHNSPVWQLWRYRRPHFPGIPEVMWGVGGGEEIMALGNSVSGLSPSPTRSMWEHGSFLEDGNNYLSPTRLSFGHMFTKHGLNIEC